MSFKNSAVQIRVILECKEKFCSKIIQKLVLIYSVIYYENEVNELASLVFSFFKVGLYKKRNLNQNFLNSKDWHALCKRVLQT